jgi:hypothetical protein
VVCSFMALYVQPESTEVVAMSDSGMVVLACEDSTRSARDAGGARLSNIEATCEDLPARQVGLAYGEEFLLPRTAKRIRLLAGLAWVSMASCDYVLCGGDCLAVDPAGEAAIISALRQVGIVFELS